MNSSVQPTVSPPAPEVAPIMFAPAATRAAARPPLALGLLRLARELAPFLPALAWLVVWLVWIPSSGAFYPRTWYPSALISASLLALTVALRRRVLPATAPLRWALGSFAALVAVNYLSIAWSQAPGDALDAANLLLLYLCAAWTLSLLPWSVRSLGVLLGVVALAIAAFCAGGLIQAVSASHLDPFFVQYRYSRPLDYPNATAAFAVLGLWPALVLAARPTCPWWLRAGYLGVAAFLADFALLPQSRAALLGLIVVAPLLLLAARSRGRLALRMLIVGGSLALSIPRTVAVDDAINAGRRVEPVLHRSALMMLACALGAVILGAAVALVEDRFGERLKLPRFPTGRRGKWGLAAATVVALAAAVALLAAPKVSHLVHTVVHSGRTDAATGATRLISVSPEERFDYARVSWTLFTHHPLGGVGAGNFGFHYDALRHFSKHSRYSHNLVLRVLSETGLLGLLPFLALIAALILGLARAARRTPAARGFCAAALAIGAYFLLHDSLDWLDEYPALALVAFAVVLAAGGLAAPHHDLQPAGPLRLLRRAPGAVLLVLVLLAGTTSLTLAYLSQRYVQRASAEFIAHPAAAFDDLDRAHALNPLSIDPLLTAAAVNMQLGYTARAEASLERALKLQNDWYARVELALLKADDGDRAAALEQLDEVARLDVDDPLIADVRRTLAAGGHMTPTQFSQLLHVDSGNLFTRQGIR